MNSVVHLQNPGIGSVQSVDSKSAVAIKAQNLSKTYRLYNNNHDRLKEILHPFGRKFHHEFTALDDVSFEIQQGETVGIIGKNGSGKSTLLKILTGILTPTKGEVELNGKIAALLELGAGFNPMLTGVENIYFNGMLMGYSRDEMDEHFANILAFADIGEFIHQPVKTYSSGMFVRLAFAVAVNVAPDIMIVDEALSVGDAAFQQKCLKKMGSFKENGGTILFVSHDMNAIRVLCSAAILLDKGKIIEAGEPESVVNRYNALIARDDTQIIETGKQMSHGNLKVEIIRYEMLNSDAVPAEVFVSGERATINVVIEAHETLADVVVGIALRNRFGQDVFGTNSFCHKKTLSVIAHERYLFSYEVMLDLGPGHYFLSLATHGGLTHLEDNYHWRDSVLNFEVVLGDEYFVGIARLKNTLEISPLRDGAVS